MSLQAPTSHDRRRVALFVTCLVDLMRPSVGVAAVRLLRAAGAEVVVPDRQTCCGQPNYNAGDRKHAMQVAERTISLLAPYEQVVVPSGSCAGMMKKHYPGLFDEGTDMRNQAEALAAKTDELTVFLDRVGAVPLVDLMEKQLTYHDSCSGLRELGVHDQPRKLLNQIPGLDLVEMAEPDVCCGFGGLFCVKYPDISGRMVENKAADIAATGADIVAMGDVGCVMNVEGRLSREGQTVRACHVAEVLAGMVDD